MSVDAHSFTCHLSVDVSLGQRAVYASAVPVQSFLETGVTREKVPFKVPCPCAQRALFHLQILHGILGTGPEDRDSNLDSGAEWPETSLQPSLGCLPSLGGGRKTSFGKKDCKMPAQYLFFFFK